ncbi:MAG: DUF3109 family protein [Bacteroidetes bacterium]|nr:DUF3109 family protein [Bacteroidota bacterium]
MIAVGKTLLSDDVIEEKFVCDLQKCKGACCVEGVSGAPLSKEETKILEDIYDKVKPYLTERGLKAIKKYGLHLTDDDGDLVTPLVNGKEECAYTIFENGMALCGIEKAWKDGVVDFRKPVSCHLYPIRITEHKNYDAVNYSEWDLCAPACKLGKKLKVPVYKFLKEALVRKYGHEWYNDLEKVVEEMEKAEK